MAKQSINTNLIPASANSKGSLNESTPAEQRAPQGAPVGDGPRLDPETGGHLPASYRCSSGIRTDR